jgi:hypothetical protein
MEKQIKRNSRGRCGIVKVFCGLEPGKPNGYTSALYREVQLEFDLTPRADNLAAVLQQQLAALRSKTGLCSRIEMRLRIQIHVDKTAPFIAMPSRSLEMCGNWSFKQAMCVQQ